MKKLLLFSLLFFSKINCMNDEDCAYKFIAELKEVIENVNVYYAKDTPSTNEEVAHLKHALDSLKQFEIYFQSSKPDVSEMNSLLSAFIKNADKLIIGFDSEAKIRLMVNMLVKYGAKINAYCTLSPLFYASAVYPNASMVKILLDLDAPLNFYAQGKYINVIKQVGHEINSELQLGNDLKIAKLKAVERVLNQYVNDTLIYKLYN